MSPPPPPSLLLPPWRSQNATSSAQRVFGSALGVSCAVPCARAAAAVADSTRARIAKIGPCIGSLVRSLLLDVPEHRRAARDESRDVAAGGGNQTPFAEIDVGRPLGGPDLRGLGDLLQPGRIGLAGEAIAELFHLRIAGPAIEGLVAGGIEIAVRQRVGEIHGRGRDQVGMPAARVGRA